MKTTSTIVAGAEMRPRWGCRGGGYVRPVEVDSTAVPPEAHPRRVVATYDSYAEAERAVDFLSDSDFPVERVAIVGTGLKMTEQVTGRLTISRAAVAGARQGALIGLIFALLLGLFFEVSGAFIAVLLYGVVTGALFGAGFGALAQAAQGGKRDFASASGVTAEHYEVQVDEQVASEAGELLTGLGPS